MKKEELSSLFGEFLEKHFGGPSEEHQGDYQGIAKAADEDKMHFTAVVLRPDVVDLHGDIYDADVVEKACHEYNELCRQANLQHLVQTELAVPIESYIAKSDFELGDGQVLKGDWVMTMKIKDDAIWKMCKDGTFTGFSVGCTGLTEALNG